MVQKKEIEYTKEDVLIYEENEKYWYSCKNQDLQKLI